MSAIAFFKKITIIASSLILVFSLQGCPWVEPHYHFDYEIIITDTPANLEGLNSVYNDYNSDLPYQGSRVGIYFSTDRNSYGSEFDIIARCFDISYHERDDVLNITIPQNAGESMMDRKLIPLITTGFDELGPFTYFEGGGMNYLFYAHNGSEENEFSDFDIQFVYTPRLDWGTYNGQQRLYGPFKADPANSEFDDMYPVISDELGKFLFCSNRENDSFDIYSFDLGQGPLFHDFLSGTSPVEITKESVLSSAGNDKCPSLYGDYLVFASDREGGYGGFDLYYSKYENNAWTDPVNFGSKVNSANDEYRPVMFSFLYFSLMVFSSDRPGGKGGFDLYCVDISDVIEVPEGGHFWGF